MGIIQIPDSADIMNNLATINNNINTIRSSLIQPTRASYAELYFNSSGMLKDEVYTLCNITGAGILTNINAKTAFTSTLYFKITIDNTTSYFTSVCGFGARVTYVDSNNYTLLSITKHTYFKNRLIIEVGNGSTDPSLYTSKHIFSADFQLV